MTGGPNIARIGALPGDTARASMLSALMSGKALTASELAGCAGITRQTASTHLAGSVGGALLARFEELTWSTRQEGWREVQFSNAGASNAGARAFDRLFALSTTS